MNSGTTAFMYVTVRILLALALGVSVGWFAGSVWAGVSGVLALYLAWNLWQLRELWFWLQHRSVADPPDAMGLWGDVVAQVVRLHRRKRFHKERLTRLFRELRRSTAAMPDGVVMLDPQGEIVWFNRKAGELLDLSRRADLGLRIDNLVRHPDFVEYLRGGQYSLPVIVRIGSQLDEGEERVLLVQHAVSGEMDDGKLPAARAKLAVTDELLAEQGKLLASEQRMVEAGEGDKLALLSAKVERATTQTARLDALIELHAALGALEEATQAPLEK